jgi:hypothetical protein
MSHASAAKQCVTCQYWGGPRKANSSRTGVDYGSDRDKGECCGGGRDRLQETATYTCGKWEKWIILR